MGRGELQLAILIETMRREGFELAISNPEVSPACEDGVRKEPLELFVHRPARGLHGRRAREDGACARARWSKMVNHGSGRVRLEFQVPTRGLIGIRTEIMTDTRGTAVMNSLLEGCVEWQGEIPRRPTGVLVADRAGDTTAYALSTWRSAASCSSGPGTAVYEGMIVGENARPADMDVNVTKAEEAHQHARLDRGRGHPPDAAPPAEPGAGARVHQQRRAGRGDAPGHPPAQARRCAANQRTKWKKAEA